MSEVSEDQFRLLEEEEIEVGQEALNHVAVATEGLRKKEQLESALERIVAGVVRIPDKMEYTVEGEHHIEKRLPVLCCMNPV